MNKKENWFNDCYISMASLCPVCKLKRSSLFLKTSRRILRHCVCGAIYVWPQPKKNAIKKLYQNGYFHLGKRKKILGYRDYEEQKKYLLPYYQKKLEQIDKLREGRKGKLLDIGCAFGYFLGIAKNKGWRVVGLDISELAIKKTKRQRIKAVAVELSKAKFSSNGFDVITIFQTVEHDPDPIGLLAEIYRILKPGGILLLTTPGQRGILVSLLGKKWHGWQVKSHLFWFNQGNLKLALQKAGFAKIEVTNDKRSLNSLINIAKVTCLRYPNKGTKILFEIVNRLPGGIKEIPLVPPVDLWGLLAVAIK